MRGSVAGVNSNMKSNDEADEWSSFSFNFFFLFSCGSLHGLFSCFLALLKCVICWLTSSPSPPLSLLMWLSRALTYQKLNLMIIRNRLGDSIHCLGFKHIILVFCDGLHTIFKHPVGMNDTLVEDLFNDKQCNFSLFRRHFLAIDKTRRCADPLHVSTTASARHHRTRITECW